MKNRNYLALGFFGAIALWMLSGVWASVPEVLPESDEEKVNLMKVSTLLSTAESVNREIILQGELEPIKQIAVRAKTASSIVELVRDKGELVEQGETIFRLDLEDRKAQLASAQAAVANAELELSAAKKLKKKGLQSDNLVKSARSALAQAKAQLARAQLEIQNVDVKAPFKGIIERRPIDLGSRVDVGEELATLVDESVIKAIGFVPQQSVTKLAIGQTVLINLLDGRQAEGKITFVARVGDKETHSFRIEAEILNQDGLLNAGTSAQLIISTGVEKAHFLSASTFALDDAGDVGVKAVDDNDQVLFHPIKIIKTETSGFWVTGLPEESEIITLGQGFVVKGEKVVPVPAS